MKGGKMRRLVWCGVILLILLLAGCHLPADDQEGELDPASATIVAETVAAAQRAATSGETGDDDSGQDSSGTDQAGATPTATQQSTGGTEEPDDEEDNGTDQARFISDVTIEDYTSVSPGEELTKTWRLQNVGTATWTTEYALVFDNGDQMDAPFRVPFLEEVPPQGYVNISVDFTAPDEAGEYSSYWMLENEDGDSFGTGAEFDQPIWMIIVVTSDELQTGSSDTGVAGGAAITNATVSANPVNYSGSCPAQISFTYTATTSNAGIVNLHLIFTTISPSGYVFDDPGVYSQTVAGATTLSYQYLFLPNSDVTATARVQAIGSNTFTSPPLQFSVNCN
jgi:hypothetical protein